MSSVTVSSMQNVIPRPSIASCKAARLSLTTIPCNSDARTDAPLEGEIEVSADIASMTIAAVQRGFGDRDGIRVSGR